MAGEASVSLHLVSEKDVVHLLTNKSSIGAHDSRTLAAELQLVSGYLCVSVAVSLNRELICGCWRDDIDLYRATPTLCVSGSTEVVASREPGPGLVPQDGDYDLYTPQQLQSTVLPGVPVSDS